MAPPRYLFLHHSLILLINCIIASSSIDFSTPMIIPLHLSTPNISDHRKFFANDYLRRRKLQNSKLPNALMRLHDDLLSNGYYTTRLFIGTPPQEFALIVDTGSTVTYVPCSTCEHCGLHQDPRFQPDASSTYKPMKCNPSCNCDDEGKQCTYERRYAEMSSSTGVLAEDIISFGNESQLRPQRAVFGCENSETGDLFSQRADGIMGLGRGPLSIVDQLVDKEAVGDSFSLCYGGMDVGGGAMVLGRISPPADMVFTHSDPYRSQYYNIDLKELHVAGKRLNLNPKIFDGKHGTVLDSGTTYAYLPEEAFLAFKDAVMKEIKFLKQIPGPDPNYGDICFSGAGRDVTQLSKIFPEVDMVFSNNEKLVLSPENYLFRHTKVSGAYCLGIFQNGKDPTTLLGGILVRNTLVTYERENDKIGFLKTNCSELWKTLQVPKALAPSPLVSPTGNKSEVMPPAEAPNGVPAYSFPGEVRIGIITFEMLIRVKNSSMKPNLTEVAELIAHELEINNLQVHVLNFTLEGDKYLVRWGIFPAGSSDYISNTTAMNIITQLKDHRMKFPERIGSYQLVEWKIEPQQKHTWWQKHLVAVVAGALATLIVSLASIGMWMVWRRRRREHGTYEPVGAVVPEQELQTL
ncbi:Eukaryotic aspartyl protease family protein [Euphorbia peplus]|nr:Eukaryotic aspartyl protease family protein [Euphorbia peplus]